MCIQNIKKQLNKLKNKKLQKIKIKYINIDIRNMLYLYIYIYRDLIVNTFFYKTLNLYVFLRQTEI